MYDIHLNSDTICNFQCVWFPPLHPPPGFPFSTFFLNLILTYLFPACFTVSHLLCGSSVTTIFLRRRMSFHRGTGGGLGGASSWHARVLVNKTIWLYGKERPYRRRNSEELACTPPQSQRHRNKHTSSSNPWTSIIVACNQLYRWIK